MSAFIVSHDHIDALLTFAKNIYNVPERATKTEIGRLLLKENVRSVAHRYPGEDEGDLPGRIGETVDDYQFRMFEPFIHMPPTKKAAWVLKACACFDYQACETDDYEQSIAHKIIREIEAQAINSLPYYEGAPWGINRERITNGSKDQ